MTPKSFDKRLLAFFLILACCFAEKDVILRDLPSGTYIYKEDKAIYDLSMFFKLSLVSTIETDQCGKNARYLGPFSDTGSNVGKYSTLSDCTKVDWAGNDKGGIYWMLCSKRYLVLFKSELSQQTFDERIDLFQELKDKSDITACTGLQQSFFGNDRHPLFVGCVTSDKLHVIGAFELKTTENGGAVNFSIEKKDRFEFAAKDGIDFLGENLTIDVFTNTIKSDIVDIFVRNINLGNTFNAYAIHFKAGKFFPVEDLKIVKDTDIKGFPQDIKILDITSEASVLALTYTKGGVAENFYVIACDITLDPETATDERKCGDEILFQSCPKEQAFKAVTISTQILNTIDVIGYSTNLVHASNYNIGKLNGAATLKLNTDVPDFEYKLDGEAKLTTPKWAFRFDSRIYLVTEEAQITTIWTDVKNSMDIKIDDLISKGSGVPYIAFDEFSSNEFDLFFFRADDYYRTRMSSPLLILEADPEVQSTEDKEIKCSIQLRNKGSGMTESKLSWNILYDPKKKPLIKIPSKSVNYAATDFFYPIFTDSFSGNAVTFDFNVEPKSSELVATMFFVNQLEFTDKTPKKMLSQALSSQSVSWLADKFYSFKKDKIFDIMKCTSPESMTTVWCSKVGAIEGDSFKGGANILSSAKNGNQIFVLLDLSTNGKVNSEGNAIALAIYNIDKKTTQLLLTSELLKDAVVDAYEGSIIIYGVGFDGKSSLGKIRMIQFAQAPSYSPNVIASSSFGDANLPVRVCPADLQLFPHKSNRLLIYSSCKQIARRAGDINSIVQIEFKRQTPTKLKLIDTHHLADADFSQPSFCANSGHIHAFESNKNIAFKVLAYDSDAEEGSIYTYPVDKFLDSPKYVAHACDGQKNMLFFILQAKAGDEIKQYLVALNGEAQDSPHKRIHSITEVDPLVDGISASYDPFSYETISILSNSKKADSFVYYKFQPNTARIFVDTSKNLSIGTFKLNIAASIQNDKATELTAAASIEFEQFNGSGKIALKGNEKFNMTTESGKSQLINLEEMFNIKGIVRGIEYVPVLKKEQNKNIITQRLNPTSSYTDFFENAIGMQAIDTSYLLIWKSDSVNFYKDGVSLLESPIAGVVEDADILNTKNGPIAFLIVGSIDTEAQNLYVIYIPDGETKYKVAVSSNELPPNQLDAVFNEGVAPGHYTMVSVNNYLAPQITYNSFTVDTSNKIEYQSKPFRKIFSEKVHSFSTSTFGQYTLTAALVGNYEGVYFSLGYTEITDEVIFKEITSQNFRIVQKDTVYHIDNEDSLISCHAAEKDIEKATLVCFIATHGVYSYFATISFNSFTEITKNPLAQELIKKDASSLKDLFNNVIGYHPTKSFFNGKYAVSVLLRDEDVIDPATDKNDLLNQQNLVTVFKMDDDAGAYPYAVVTGEELKITERSQNKNITPLILLQEKEGKTDSLLYINSKENMIKRWILSSFLFSIESGDKLSPAKDQLSILSLKKDVESTKLGEIAFIDNDPGSGSNKPTGSPEDDNTNPDTDTPFWKRRIFMYVAGAVGVLVLILIIAVFYFLCAKKGESELEDDLNNEKDAATIGANTESEYSNL